jgi:hypothetical protein
MQASPCSCCTASIFARLDEPFCPFTSRWALQSFTPLHGQGSANQCQPGEELLEGELKFRNQTRHGQTGLRVERRLARKGRSTSDDGACPACFRVLSRTADVDQSTLSMSLCHYSSVKSSSSQVSPPPCCHVSQAPVFFGSFHISPASVCRKIAIRPCLPDTAASLHHNPCAVNTGSSCLAPCRRLSRLPLTLHHPLHRHRPQPPPRHTHNHPVVRKVHLSPSQRPPTTLSSLRSSHNIASATVRPARPLPWATLVHPRPLSAIYR